MPYLFYLLDYGFLPQNVSEAEKTKKTRLSDPKVQIVTVSHYCEVRSEDGSLVRPVLVCVYNRI
jgi:hypothetical protein